MPNRIWLHISTGDESTIFSIAGSHARRVYTHPDGNGGAYVLVIPETFECRGILDSDARVTVFPNPHAPTTLGAKALSIAVAAGAGASATPYQAIKKIASITKLAIFDPDC